MPQAGTSLKHRASPLSDASAQLQIIQSVAPKSFESELIAKGMGTLRADGVEIIQVNLGKLCNMTCRHCHVDAGPDRREIMPLETINQCLDAIRTAKIETVDLTGGAPEMNPNFRHFVTEARSFGAHVIDRCNLTILLAQGYEDLPGFFAKHQVEVVASLPCYMPENTDAQRGEGAYEQSIEAIKRLNAVGYGREDGLLLTLVFNPVGPSLPPDQKSLEAAYREYLKREFDIDFNRLFTITNMPISRFLDDLVEAGRYEEYMEKLIDSFNPAAAAGVMCRKMISVGWDGFLFDCDFNQMLEINLHKDQVQHIRDFNAEQLRERKIVVGQHCFGCTAAAGSGCLGAIDG
ncbi:MAG: arsenosugar biosynthesis radical SAM (seleno)protein ArsS [Planctomycetaceae bacterium]